MQSQRSPQLLSGATSEYNASSPQEQYSYFMKMLQQNSDFHINDVSSQDEQQADIQRKTKSHSPATKKLIHMLYKESPFNSPSTSQENGQSHEKEVDKPQVRKKSCDSLTLTVIQNYYQFRNYIIREKSLSDIELCEIKNNLIEPERLKQSQVNYFTIFLGDLVSLIDQFVEQTVDQLLQLQKSKEIIIKFDKLRSDMLNKVKPSEKSQTLTKDNIQLLNVIFGYLRFILTRFGRTINFFDVFQSAHQKKIYTRASSKQPPAIRKIMQQESLLLSESDQARRSPASTSSFSSKKNESMDSTEIQQAVFKNSGLNLSNIMKSPFQNSGSLKHPDIYSISKPDQIREIFYDLTEKEKQNAISKYMQLLTKKWREEYEEERKLNVPLIICRLCSKKFYADKEKEHSQYCMEKINIQKERQQLNQRFLEMSNKFTECMLFVEKVNQFNTPRLPHQPKTSLLNTPTLKRRSPLIPGFFMTQESFNSDSINDAEETSKKSSFYMHDKNKVKNIEVQDEGEKELFLGDDDEEEKEIIAPQQQKTISDKPQMNMPIVPMLNLKQLQSEPPVNPNKVVPQQAQLKVPKLDFGKIGLFQQEPQPPVQSNPQNPLLLYSAKKAGDLPSSSLSQRQGGIPSAQTKNTLNTLRGLETNKNLKLFDSVKTLQTQVSSTGLEGVDVKPLETVVSVQEPPMQEPQILNKPPEPVVPQKPPKKIQSIFSLGPKNEKEEEKKMPNILSAFASIRNDGKQEKIVKQPPASARNAFSNALGFFKAQKNEEKKNITDTKVITNSKQKNDKSDKQEKDKVPKPLKSKKSNDISLIQIPKSPYLQNVTRKFEKVQSKYLEPQPNIVMKKEEPKQKKIVEIKESKINQVIQATQITSPYIGMSKNLTKEERSKHFENLKKHVQIQMQKGTVAPVKGQRAKQFKTTGPISNAFQLEIKNERQEIIKNMEHLRKSVKLKKRATPLEKIMTKLVTYDNEDQFTPQFNKTKPPGDVYSFPATDQSQMKVANSVAKNSTMCKSQLQAIVEDQEDDLINNQKQVAPSKPDQEVQIVEKKIEDLGQLNKTKNFGGASPIITFRPLNRFGSDQSSQNTPLGTPFIRGAVTQRDANSTETSSQLNDEQRSHQIIQSLQTAKKELDILENLKSLAVDIFNLTIQVKQIKSKQQIFTQYLDQLQIIQQQNLVSQNSMGIVQQFIELLISKIKILDQIQQLDRKYKKTLPGQVQFDFDEEEKTLSSKIERKINAQSQAQEAPSSLTSQRTVKKKESGIFFPVVNSPRRGSFNNTLSKQNSIHLDGSLTNNDGSLIPFAQFDKLQLQNSATPLIHSRGFNFQQIPDASKFQPLKFPPALLSLSQVNSPQVMERSLPYLTTSKTLQQEQSNLNAITEEENQQRLRMAQQKRDQNQIGRVRGAFAQNQQRQKSQFSNQNQAHKSASNTSLGNDSISQGSFSSESQTSSNESDYDDAEIVIPYSVKNVIKLGDLNSQQLPPILNDKPPEGNKQISPLSKKSKQSQLSTFSKNKTVTDKHSTLSAKHNSLQMEEDQKNDFFFDGENISKYDLVRRFGGDQTGAGSFRLNVQRTDNSMSRMRKLKKKVTSISQHASRKNSLEYIECQSDIVIGMNYDQDRDCQDERKTNSDIHDMFYVNDLFQDDKKFYRMLAQLQINEALASTYNDVVEVKVQEINDIEDEDEEEEDDVLTMDRVRFNSTCILPSQIECCSLEYQEKNQKQQLSINDFILLKTVSKGAYGKVILARQKNTNDLFAIKVLDKQKMVEKNVIEFIMNERNIMSQVSNAFIVKGVYAFQSKKFLYFVMEFMKGGDFASLLESVGAFDEETVKYYIAQVVLALDHLHSNGIIHRDMKPDNILIDSEGRIKLTDFGLSETGLKKFRDTVKKVSNTIGTLMSPNQQQRELDMQQDIQMLLGADVNQLKTKKSVDAIKSNEETKVEKKIDSSEANKKKDCGPKKRILGTAHYMAPEVIQGEDHTTGLDFWSLGVIVYEFLTGSLPFKGDTPEEVFANVLKRNVKYPPVGRDEDEMSPEAFDFIERLLTLDPTKRLGANGVKEVQEHPFFKGFEWNKIMEMKAPFRPVGRDQDAQYFPKATDQDDDIQIIINDNITSQNQEAKEFDKFNTICYGTLQDINAKEAKMAMIRADRMKKKSPAPKPKQSLLNETILLDIKSGLNSMEQLVESQEEDGSSTPKHQQ